MLIVVVLWTLPQKMFEEMRLSVLGKEKSDMRSQKNPTLFIANVITSLWTSLKNWKMWCCIFDFEKNPFPKSKPLPPSPSKICLTPNLGYALSLLITVIDWFFSKIPKFHVWPSLALTMMVTGCGKWPLQYSGNNNNKTCKWLIRCWLAHNRWDCYLPKFLRWSLIIFITENIWIIFFILTCQLIRLLAFFKVFHVEFGNLLITSNWTLYLIHEGIDYCNFVNHDRVQSVELQ